VEFVLQERNIGKCSFVFYAPKNLQNGCKETKSVRSQLAFKNMNTKSMRKFNKVTYLQNITPYLDHRNFCELKELGKHIYPSKGQIVPRHAIVWLRDECGCPWPSLHEENYSP
jgi:hypothetical protein